VRLSTRFAVLVLGFLFSGVAAAADSDGDGVDDAVDVCPTEDASGHDLYVDGCIDTVDDFAPFLRGLGLEEDAWAVLAPIARGAARAAARDHLFLAALQVHAAQGIARALFYERLITLDQLHAINDFARALVETM
jgi:hypothetical protein